MTLSRALARPLVAGMYVYGGYDALMHPEGKVEKAQVVADAVGPPVSTETLVRLNGAVQMLAGTSFALGRAPRTSAAILAGSLIPTTYAGHRFWEEDDQATADQQRVHFLKNLSMLGGLLLASLDTEGRPSVPYKAKQAASAVPELAHSRRRRRRSSSEGLGLVGLWSGLRWMTRNAGRVAAVGAKHAAESARQASENAKHETERAVNAAPRIAAAAKQEAKRASAEAARVADRARHEAAPLMAEIVDRLQDVVPEIVDRVQDVVPERLSRIAS